MDKFKLPRAYRKMLAEAGRKGAARRLQTQTVTQLSDQGKKAALASVAARAKKREAEAEKPE